MMLRKHTGCRALKSKFPLQSFAESCRYRRQQPRIRTRCFCKEEGAFDNSSSEESPELQKLQDEFNKILAQNFDGLELRRGPGAFEDLEDNGVKVWIEKDGSEEPEVEAQELFEWWTRLEDVYVLVFQLGDGNDDGIFTLREDEDSDSNFILSFEGKDEAIAYAENLLDTMDEFEAEIECISRDEILQLCTELNVGIKIVQLGGVVPEIPSHVTAEVCHTEEDLEDIRQALENLLPDDDVY